MITKKIWHKCTTVDVLLLCATFIFSACGNHNTPTNSFQGDDQAIALAEEMFAAIGGKQSWCDLRSLYVKAIHTEPQMTIPYQSEIWRAMDEFHMVIEQQNDSFHVKAVIDGQGGTVRYYDDRDTFRTLTPEQTVGWAHGHQHNIYVLLHAFGCSPQDYVVQIDQEDRMSFYQDSTFVASFGFDDQMRPHLFFVPGEDGTISGSRFTHWGSHAGLIHSAGGHPLDSNFIYQTDVWLPSNKSLKESFEAQVFEVD